MGGELNIDTMGLFQLGIGAVVYLMEMVSRLIIIGRKLMKDGFKMEFMKDQCKNYSIVLFLSLKMLSRMFHRMENGNK